MAHVNRMRFDAILSDVMMGEIDGFAFRDMVRQVDPKVPIVFVTSVVNDYGNWLLDKISSDVRSYFVGKGMSREQLQLRLRQIIDSNRSEDESERILNTYNSSLEMASVVQHSLLPQWTAAEKSYHYGVAWNPYEKVSGDLYEWIRLASDKVLLVIGDVSGHGIRSALAMTAIQAFIKRYHVIDVSQAERVHLIARGIHKFIRENFGDVIYMACTVIYVDFGANRIRFLDAGLPEPICVSGRTGERIPLNPDHLGCLPLGLTDDEPYGQDMVVERTFSDDAVFFFASDGVTDTSADPEGNDFVPQMVYDEVCSIVAVACFADNTLIQAAAMTVSALKGMGYVYAQDDRLLVVFGKAQHRTDRLIHGVRLTPEAVDRAAEYMGTYAAELSGDPAMSTKVQLVLGEFLLNVYKHGLELGDQRGEYGIVMVSKANGMIEMTIWDCGREWKGLTGASPDDIQQHLEKRNEDMSVSGRGVVLMSSISDGGVSHERISMVNKTIFRIPIMGDGLK